jgi:hypothetical protein
MFRAFIILPLLLLAAGNPVCRIRIVREPMRLMGGAGEGWPASGLALTEAMDDTAIAYSAQDCHRWFPGPLKGNPEAENDLVAFRVHRAVRFAHRPFLAVAAAVFRARSFSGDKARPGMKPAGEGGTARERGRFADQITSTFIVNP